MTPSKIVIADEIFIHGGDTPRMNTSQKITSGSYSMPKGRLCNRARAIAFRLLQPSGKLSTALQEQKTRFIARL